jgi:hypothetical protein
MTEKESVRGLGCPNCGGMVPIPEGQAIVICPYCDLRSMVRGERGLRRYQVPRRVEREQALQALHGFFSAHRAIAPDAARRSSLEEAFVAYIPFWASWARVLGWIFGQKRERRGDNTYYEPREIRFAQDLSWTRAACDVGEFGVDVIPLTNQPMEPFDPAALHASGMVFEPVGSASQARAAAMHEFDEKVQSSARLDRVAQVFTRSVRQRMGLVYYPLWVLRYRYRGRAFQVVVDGYSGQVLYGKAPGSTLYRAGVLVGGTALGAVLAVDGSAAVFTLAANSDSDDVGGLIIGGLVLLGVGIGVIAAAYRAFRYGEQFEYRRDGPGASGSLFQVKEIMSQVEGLETWIKRLS